MNQPACLHPWPRLSARLRRVNREFRRAARKHCLHPFAIDILPAQNHGRSSTVKPLALLDQRRERCSTGALGALVSGPIHNPDRLGDLVIRHLDDPIGAALDKSRRAARTAMPSAKVSAELVTADNQRSIAIERTQGLQKSPTLLRLTKWNTDSRTASANKVSTGLDAHNGLQFQDYAVGA
jgi:hypothetical protein